MILIQEDRQSTEYAEALCTKTVHNQEVYMKLKVTNSELPKPTIVNSYEQLVPGEMYNTDPNHITRYGLYSTLRLAVLDRSTETIYLVDPVCGFIENQFTPGEVKPSAAYYAATGEVTASLSHLVTE